VHEPDQHPSGNQGCLDGDHRFEQREVGAFGLRRRGGVVAGDRMIGEGVAIARRRRSTRRMEAPDSQVTAGDADQHGAGSTVSRSIGRPVLTTASERVVGTPSACIASLTMYSRSIGPTAARPSPPRANGVRPDPLRWRVPERDRRRRRAREQQRPSVAQPRDEATELVPGVGLGDRGRTAGHQVARQKPQPVRATQPRGVEAKRGGQRLVQDEQPQVRRLLGLPGTPISGNSRAKRFCRATFISGATLTPSRLRRAGRLADGCSDRVACAVEHRCERSDHKMSFADSTPGCGWVGAMA